MATITARKRANGTTAYRALVRIKRCGNVVFKETRTFDRKVAAQSWAKRLELELEKPGAIDARQLSQVKLGELITRYIDEVGQINPLGRTKRFTLEKLANSSLADLPARELSPQHIINFCIDRKNQGAGPATVLQDVAFLRSVLNVVKPIWGLPLDASAIELAQPTLKKLNLVGKGHKRDRRPTPEEINQLNDHFKSRDQRSELPMLAIFNFAILTAMRQSEICGITWQDLDPNKKTVIIRDRKDPSNKQGNDQQVPLLGGAFDLAMQQKRVATRIFPYNARSVSAAFTRSCAKLKIFDLRFHDLRHEGASRLFELGYSIEQVALVTGHKDWNMLRRYTQLKPESLHR